MDDGPAITEMLGPSLRQYNNFTKLSCMLEACLFPLYSQLLFSRLWLRSPRCCSRNDNFTRERNPAPSSLNFQKLAKNLRRLEGGGV